MSNLKQLVWLIILLLPCNFVCLCSNSIPQTLNQYQNEHGYEYEYEYQEPNAKAKPSLNDVKKQKDNLNQSLPKLDALAKEQRAEMYDYFKTLFLDELNMNKIPNNPVIPKNQLPKQLLDSFITKNVNNINNLIPFVTEASTDYYYVNGFNTTRLKFKLPNDLFRHEDTINIDVFIDITNYKFATDISFHLLSNNPNVFIQEKEITFELNYASKRKSWAILKTVVEYSYISQSSFPENLIFTVQDDINFINNTLFKSQVNAIIHAYDNSLANERVVRGDLECDQTTECCVAKTRVDFHELGWTNWIVKPTSFMISYCIGPCQNLQSHFTIHSNILRRMIHVYKENAPKLQLCCAPSEMYTYSVLHYDTNGGITSSKIPDMEVKSCTCT